MLVQRQLRCTFWAGERSACAGVCQEAPGATLVPIQAWGHPGEWRDQVSAADSGPRSVWGRGLGWHCSGRGWPIPEWWRDQGLRASELCAYGWVFEQEVEAIGDRLLEGQAR